MYLNLYNFDFNNIRTKKEYKIIKRQAKNMKLRGSAMYYTLMLSLVVISASSLLIVLAYFNRIHSIKVETDLALINNCYSGLEMLNSTDIEYGIHEFQLFKSDENSKVFLKKYIWGAYDVISSTSIIGSKTKTKSQLLGANSKAHQYTALYLSNTIKSISISGSTEIRGSSYIPKEGIKRAVIDKNFYKGDKLIYGETKVSESKLPELNDRFILTHQKIFEAFKNQSITYSLENFELKDLNQSFKDSTIILSTNNPLKLNNLSLQNNVVIYSSSTITIDKNSNLDNILILAKSVKIDDYFEGSAHLIAEDSITIGENVEMKYPSSIICYSFQNNFIKISKNSSLKGTILLKGQNEHNKYPILSIDENSLIEGDVYVDGKVALKGSIYGSLFCNGFLLKTSSGLYENYLLDAVINNEKKHTDFVSGILLKDYLQKRNVKWIE